MIQKLGIIYIFSLSFPILFYSCKSTQINEFDFDVVHHEIVNGDTLLSFGVLRSSKSLRIDDDKYYHYY